MSKRFEAHEPAAEAAASSGRPAPGRSTITQSLQRRASPAAPQPTSDATTSGATTAAGDDPFAIHLGDPHAAAAEGVASAGASLPHLDAIAASFGPDHDLSGVRAQVGGAAASASASIGAEAYALDGQVGFARAPDLHTAAHEAAHVVQQRGGLQLKGGLGTDGDEHERHADAVADRVVAGLPAGDLLAPYQGGGASAATLQLRRLPSTAGTLLQDPADPTLPGANFAASCEGMKRLLARAIRELQPADLTSLSGTLGVDWQTRLTASTDPQFITQVSDAIRAVRPDLTLGDPALINIAPTAGSVDETNLATLVAGTNTVFDAIIGGGHDADLEQVFGAANVEAARTKYVNGKTWLNNLNGSGAIVTDRSGYSGEVGLGGLTGFQSRISLSPQIFDNPSAPSSVVTTLHESMHAGNADVRDYGYIHQPAFIQLAESVKLTNAAHFEVPARRILGTNFAFAGQTFVPAGTSVGGVVAPPLTDAEQVIRQTSEKFRLAWTYGLNLHSLFRTAHLAPTEWTTDRSGKTWARSLPYWSQVMKLTVHEKTNIVPTSANPAEQPVSQIDMALAEGLTRRLMLAMRAVPANEAAMTTLEDGALAEPERIAARASIDARKTSLVRLVLQSPTVGELTGPLDRDVRVVEALSTLVWSTVLDDRDVTSFPD